MPLRILFMFCTLLLLSSCKGFIQNNINKATDEPAAGLSQFELALEKGYLDLAQREVSEDDFRDANYFLRRSLAVKSGQNVQPTNIGERSFTPTNQARAERGRSALIDFLNGPIRNSRPSLAAQAQIMFDCWMQELEENSQPRDISVCEDGFASSINGLEGISTSSATAATSTTTATSTTETASTSTGGAVAGTYDSSTAGSEAGSQATSETIVATGTLGNEVMVYFPFDTHNKITGDVAAITEAAADAQSKGVTFVLITASTDTSGSFDYNYKLSKKRGEYVRGLLTFAGIDASIVNIVALGEKNLPVQTADGVKEPRNRRAKVEFRF